MRESTYKLKEKPVGADASVRPFFKRIPKDNNGITLIALIITIVVMLILVGVTVSFTIEENGILSQTKEAKKEYEIAQLKETFWSNYALEYYQKTGYWPSDEAITKIAEASIETGVDVNKFIVYHDGYAITQNEENKDVANYEKMPEEFVFYDWNKVTLEEMEKLEVEYTPSQAESDTLCNLTNRCFSIDTDGDGYLTEQDIDEVELIAAHAITELIFEQEKHDLLAKVCFDTDKNNTVYSVIQEFWRNPVGLGEAVMFLWQLLPYYMGEQGYANPVYETGDLQLMIAKQKSFNYVVDNHIYYNSERVPSEQEVTE